MDLVQDWSAYLLSPSNPFRPYAFQMLSYTSIIKAYTAPLLSAITQKPDLATLALLLLILFLSLKILGMLYNTVVFWIRLGARVVFWGGIAALGLWMWMRGPEGMFEDVGNLSGRWKAEYEFFTERQRTERMARGVQQPYGGGAEWS